MSRKPKPKNTLSAGQRAALYEEEVKRRAAELSGEEQLNNSETVNEATDTQKPARTPEKKKEKPLFVSVKADFAVKGEPLSALHGMSGGPLSCTADISPLYRDLKVPYIRLCGACAGNYALDIGKIFPDFSADETRAESYFFRAGDEHVLAAVNTGAKVILCLGEGFAQAPYDRLLTLPDDLDKITKICVNIIKHYNDYWCGGFALDIRHFEIFPHADLPQLIEQNGKEKIFELYSRIANGIKLYDEGLFVGGMAFSSCSSFVRDFVRFCQRRNTPLDFLSVSLHHSSPEALGDVLLQYIKLLKNSSYESSKIIVSEWSYIPEHAGKSGLRVMQSRDISQAKARRELFGQKKSVIGASYLVASLIKMLSYPEVSIACLYSGEAGSLFCDICDPFGIPEKPYFALEAFSKILQSKASIFCRVEEKEDTLPSGVYAVATESEREAYVLLCAHDGTTSIDLRADNIPDNLYNADIYMLDGVKNMETPYTIELSGMRKRMVLNVSPYSVIFVKLY